MIGALLTYQGYQAKVEFSNEVGCFVGHVLGIPDTLAFDGQTAEEVTQSFHVCINEYLKLRLEIDKVSCKERRS